MIYSKRSKKRIQVFELAASLSLDKSQYERGLNEAEKSGSSIGSRIGAGFAKVGKAVALGIGAASTAVGTATVVAGKKLTNLAIDTAAAGDIIDKSSQKLGLSAEAYQEWDYVLSQSGVDIESAGMGFKTLTNQIDSAKKGSKEAQERFAKLGISMDDINKLSREELFTKAIMGMQGLADNTDRAALANQLFGRSGQELAPLFNSTAESTEALMQKAHELGFVMSDEAVSATVKYTDSLDTLKRTFQGVKNNIVEKLQQGAKEIVESLEKIAPRIVDVLLTIVESVAEIAPAIIDSLVQGIANNAGKIITAAANIIKSFNQSLVKALPQIVKAIVDMIPSILDGFKAVFAEIVKALPSLVKAIIDALPKLIPQFVSAIVDCVVLLMKNIGQIIQPLVEKLPDIIVSIVDALIDNLPKLIDGVISLILGLVKAIPKIILGIIEALPTIIEKIITGLIECIPQLIEGLITLVIELVAHLPEIILGLIEAIPKIIVAVAKALVEAGPKIFEAFGRIFGGAWEKITEIFSGIVDWFKDIFEKLKMWAVSVYTKIIAWFKSIFEGLRNWALGIYIKITSFFQNIWNSITGVFSKVGEFFSNVFRNAVDGVKGAFNGIKQWFSNLWQNIWNGIKTPINWIIDGINAVIGGLNSLKVDIPDWVPFVGGQTWGVNIPKIAKLAKGGFVEGGTPFIAGEAGAEAVIPLENNNQWIYKFAHAFADGLSTFYDGGNLTQTPTKGAGGKVVNINLYLDNVNVKNDDDIEDVANKVSERIAEKLVMEGMAVG